MKLYEYMVLVLFIIFGFETFWIRLIRLINLIGTLPICIIHLMQMTIYG